MSKEENTKREEYIKEIVSNLPDSPGCYQYLNDSGAIIYVGKAKNLKRRVSSYFNKEQQSLKTRLLVSKIADIRYIVVNSEADALLLENNLIKRHKPRYNILLKDDKTSTRSRISPALYLPRYIPIIVTGPSSMSVIPYWDSISLSICIGIFNNI